MKKKHHSEVGFVCHPGLPARIALRSMAGRRAGMTNGRLSIHRAMGMTLIELLIYIAVLSVLFVGVFNIFLVTMRIRAHNNATFTVNENARVVQGSIRDALLDADSVATGGSCPLNTLIVTAGATTTTFHIDEGVVYRTENTDPARALTASSVALGTTASCLFTKIENPPPAQPTVQVKLRVAYNTPGNPRSNIAQDYQLSVSLR